MSDRWRKIEELFQAAQERPEGQRAAFLEEACTEDEDLRRDVESLLAQEKEAESFLETPAIEVLAQAMARGGPGFLLTQKLGPYQILSLIGSGGMGAVYEAYDEQRHTRVALKTLLHLDPGALNRFKKEFRYLTDVSHPNLVSLCELFCHENQWCFTMEFVEGVNFLEHVCPDWRLAEPDSISIAPAAQPEEKRRNTLAAGAHPELPPETTESQATKSSSPCDVSRLRPALRQLAEAVHYLHAAGILHRDLKPLNVKITPQGRVVVLDFGLVAHVAAERLESLTQHMIAGTVPYMSPEQAAGQNLAPATDWYSVGVMVYEALTGRCPFQGSLAQVLQDKQRLDPLAPAEFMEDIPEDLNAICMGLLRRDPQVRWSGEEVLRLLQPDAAGKLEASAPSLSPATKRLFVGRESHLAVLREAFATTERNVTCAVYVHGKSGMGKSTLVERFLDELSGRTDLVVLAGRCYEQESVPYKAFDSVVDSLTRYMIRLPRHEAAELIPRDVGALAKVFPVLRRVEAVTDAPRRSSQTQDQHEVRRKAFGALRELFARMGDRKHLVLYMDDLQWGDLDSALLMKEIVRPPEGPVFLLIGAYRTEHIEKSPILQAMLAESFVDPSVERREVPVGPLTEEEARALAAQLLSRKSLSLDERAESIARESGGNPYFVQELVGGFSSKTDAEIEAPQLTLDTVLRKRVGELPEEARRLLEIVAVSGRPLGQQQAYQAAQLETQDPRLLAVLRSARMIRSTGPGGRDEMEAYHDRVRETVLAHLDTATLKEHHLRLATVLESSGSADAESVAIHFEGAGEQGKAGRYFAAAAEKAAAALAFKHAADLFQRALELRQETGEERRQLQVKLAEALANAGRGAEAARNYREASLEAVEPEVFELERKAAFWFVATGHLDEGREAFRKMLQRVKLEVPPSARRTLLSILSVELQLRIRGLHFRERPESEIPREDLRRIDVAWDAAREFAIMDSINGAYFSSRGLLLALRAGALPQIARSLSWKIAGTAAFRGAMGRNQVPKLLADCSALVEKTDSPYIRGFFSFAKGFVTFTGGRWKESLELFQEAEGIFRQERAGVAWELATAQLFSLWDLLELGRYEELRCRSVILGEEAREKGDLYLATSIDAGVRPFGQLVLAHPEAALKTIEDSLDLWTHKEFLLQHAIAAYIRAWIDLYQGNGTAAWKQMNAEWPKLKKHHYLRLEPVWQWLYSTRAQSAMAASLAVADAEPLLQVAERDARQLERDEHVWSHPLAKLVRAGCAARRGDPATATGLLEKAAAEFLAADMSMMAAVTRRRLGEIVGGERGQALIQEADTSMKAEGVQDPIRHTAIFLNGFPSQRSQYRM
jgi:eukaryotic-like serine/threonine-protein kinase